MSSSLNQGASERRPELSELTRRALDAYMRNMFKAIPAKVVRYDPTQGQADCKILVQHPYLDETDARQIESLPVVPNVPVMFMGSGIYRLTFPISDGTLVVNGQTLTATTGLLVFCDRSIDRWLSSTGAAQEVDPEIDHFHSKSDAVFIPGLWPFAATPEATPQNVVCIGQFAGSDFVALATQTMTNFNLLFHLIDTIFGNASAPIAAVFPGTDPVYTAIHAAIAALASNWTMQQVKSTQLKTQ